MKRAIFTLLILTSLLTLAACAGKSDPPVASSPAGTSDSVGLAYDSESDR
jgi:predicted small lipoprotein YifL